MVKVEMTYAEAMVLLNLLRRTTRDTEFDYRFDPEDQSSLRDVERTIDTALGGVEG